MGDKLILMQYCISTMFGKFFAIELQVTTDERGLMFIGTPVKSDVNGVHEPMREVMITHPYMLETLYDDYRKVMIIVENKEQKGE